MSRISRRGLRDCDARRRPRPRRPPPQPAQRIIRDPLLQLPPPQRWPAADPPPGGCLPRRPTRPAQPPAPSADRLGATRPVPRLRLGPSMATTELTKAMKGSLSHEFETGLPAADVWEVYGGLLVGDLIPQLLPQVFSKVELVEGDGGVGTVLLVTYPPGTPGSEAFKEEFIKVDNENYIKEVLVTEGSFLDHGFKKYLVRTKIIGKEQKTATIRSTIEYEVDQEHARHPCYQYQWFSYYCKGHHRIYQGEEGS